MRALKLPIILGCALVSPLVAQELHAYLRDDACAVAKGGNDPECSQMLLQVNSHKAPALSRSRSGAESVNSSTAAQVAQVQHGHGHQSVPMFDQLLSRVKNATLVNVGACDGGFAGGETNDPVEELIFEPRIQALLVEPNPPIYKILQDGLQKSFGGDPRVQAVEAAVCGGDASKEMQFYVVSDRLKQDRPDIDPTGYTQLSSLDNETLLKNHFWMAMTREQLAGYLETIKVPCLTAGDLLSKAAIEPSAINILKVDAEGVDAAIVHGFLDLPAFGAQVIIFEISWLSDGDLSDLTARLTEKGYAYSNSSEFREKQGLPVQFLPEVGDGVYLQDMYAWKKGFFD